MQALASALPLLPDLRMLLLRNNGLMNSDLQTLSAALLNPACSGICGLDLGFNKLSREVPLLLLPLLHQPPAQQMLQQQARRRSTAEAAGECEGLVPGPEASSSGSVTAAAGTDSVPRRRRTSNGGGTSTIASTSGAGSQQLQLAAAFMPQRPQQLPLRGGIDHAMLLQLVLCSNPGIGDAGAEVICKLVGTGDCLLQLLDLSGCGITERLSVCLRGMLEGARCMS